jgi:hypothetical protein
VVIVFDMVTGEVEYADGDPRTAGAEGMQCPGYREFPAPPMEPQLGLQLVEVRAQAAPAPVAWWYDLPEE